MGECMWLKISWNYKPTGRKVRGRTRKLWKLDFESGTSISCVIRKDKKKKELIASNKKIIMSEKGGKLSFPEDTPGMRIHSKGCP
jgi:hypothetical protein